MQIDANSSSAKDGESQQVKGAAAVPQRPEKTVKAAARCPPAFLSGDRPGTLTLSPNTPFPPHLLHFKDRLESGTVRHLHVGKQFGFIKTSRVPIEEDVFFYFNKIKNVSQHSVTLEPESRLRFSRDGLTQEGKVRSLPIAQYVQVQYVRAFERLVTRGIVP